MSALPVRILFIRNTTSGIRIPPRRFFIAAAGGALHVMRIKTRNPLQVSLIFESAERIRRLNKRFRGIDKATDVLSFPNHTPSKSGKGAQIGKIIPTKDPDGVVRLGEIVIAPQIAGKEATAFGHSLEQQLVFLFVHGLLHLLGYDHERSKHDQAVMDRVQGKTMRDLLLG